MADQASLAPTKICDPAGIEARGVLAEDLAEVDALEQVLHGSVIGILRNPLVEISYRRMMNYLRLLRLDRKFASPIILRTLREHVAILSACAARDVDAAEAALQSDLQAALKRIVGFM
ncbi:MAG: FCD domain-containing protein [bacterium]